MPSPNELKKARYRATAQLFEVACLNGGWTRSGLPNTAPQTWLQMGPQRRALYCSAERLMSPRLLEQLLAEYPLANEAWDPTVWVCLREDANFNFLERKLRALVGEEELELDVLLRRLSKRSLDDSSFDRALVIVYVCATKLAKSLSIQRVQRRAAKNKNLTYSNCGPTPEPDDEDQLSLGELSGLLSMRLARALYMASVDDLFAPWAKHVWLYSGHMFVRGLEVDGAKVLFSQEAFDFARDFVMNVEANITLKLFPRNKARRISASALREITANALLGLTEPSCAIAHLTMRAISELEIPDAHYWHRRCVPNALILHPIK